jgi:hypothetical protein
MPTTKEIKKYRIFLASHPSFNEWQANIFLCQQDGTVVVDLRFVTNPNQYAGLAKINLTTASLFYCGVDRLAWFVDVLRNEKPLYAVLYPGTPPRMLLQTDPEPVGETEAGG